MRRHRSLKRKVSTKLPKRKFILYTEGKNTEPDYFLAVKRSLRGTLIDLTIVRKAGDPIKIAEAARRRTTMDYRRKKARSSFEEYDEIWAVFDQDNRPHTEIEAACSICRRSNVEVAFSDPCFELWLVLHYEYFDRPVDGHAVQDRFQRLCLEYDRRKGKTANFDQMMHLIEEAEVRAARQLATRREENHIPTRPHTTVFQLTRRMREAHAQSTAQVSIEMRRV